MDRLHLGQLHKSLFDKHEPFAHNYLPTARSDQISMCLCHMRNTIREKCGRNLYTRCSCMPDDGWLKFAGGSVGSID